MVLVSLLCVLAKPKKTSRKGLFSPEFDWNLRIFGKFQRKSRFFKIYRGSRRRFCTFEEVLSFLYIILTSATFKKKSQIDYDCVCSEELLHLKFSLKKNVLTLPLSRSMQSRSVLHNYAKKSVISYKIRAFKVYNLFSIIDTSPCWICFLTLSRSASNVLMKMGASFLYRR